MANLDHPLFTRLIPAVRRLAVNLGASPTDGRAVQLRQIGRMRSSATSGWQHFTARQTIVQDKCEFDWRARYGPLGVVSVRDALIEGEGRLLVSALGIFPLVHTKPSTDLSRGELMRYLAELPWAPGAILHNTALRWREAGSNLIVAAGAGAASAEVTLSLTPEGRIAGAYAPDRGALHGAISVPTPWRGAFDDYRLHDGVWLPFAGEVSWGGPDGEWVYWQGRVADWTRGRARPGPLPNHA